MTHARYPWRCVRPSCKGGSVSHPGIEDLVPHTQALEGATGYLYHTRHCWSSGIGGGYEELVPHQALLGV